MNGVWAFAPGVLVGPGKPGPAHATEWTFCKVPAAWTDPENLELGLPYKGCGTYHLRILLPGSGGTYGLKTTTIRSAYSIFANGEEVLSGGIPGLTASTTRSVNYADAATFKVHEPVIDLYVQVANYIYPGSGMVLPIRFGIAENIKRERIRDIVLDVLIVVVLLLGVLYFPCQLLVATRKTSLDRASLYFTLFGLFLALVTLTHSEKLLYYAFPGIPYLAFCRLQIICVIACYYFLYGYTVSIFPRISQRNVMLILGILAGTGVVLVLTTTLFLQAEPLLIYQFIGLLLILMICSRMVYGLLQETVGKYYIAAGICCAIAMFAGCLLDHYTIHFGSLISKWFEPLFVISQVFYISHVQAITKEQLQEREAAFLNAQIKPHFLFNTLNTIQSLCYSDARKAGTLLAELGVFLHGRFDLKSTAGLVQLGQELDVTHAYVSIETARFASSFTYTENVNPALYEVELPPLTIQPLVENALKHGLSKQESGGCISLSAVQEAHCLYVEVSDNGMGMPADIIREVMEKKSLQEGIALWNIHQRLLSRYGFGLNFQPGAGGIGTRIFFRVPMDHKSSGKTLGRIVKRSSLVGSARESRNQKETLSQRETRSQRETLSQRET